MSLRLPRIPDHPLHRIVISHGRLSNFGLKIPPPPPRLKLLMEDPSNFGSEAAKNTPPDPRIGTFDGGLSNFGSKAAKNTPSKKLELLMEDLVIMSLRLTPPPMKTSGLMCR